MNPKFDMNNCKRNEHLENDSFKFVISLDIK